MHEKQALSSVGEHEQPVRLLTPGGGGVKVAGMLPHIEEFIDGLRPDPRYMFTLVNAMGYSEFFGPNSNKDWYGYNEYLDFNGLLHTPNSCHLHGDYEGWEKDPVIQTRVAKNWPFGYPSFYGATVYANHKNHDPTTLGFGDVIYCAQNETQKRVELVMRVDIELTRQRGHSAILDRVARGDRVDVSMGCKVPFDLCSICTDWDAVKRAWKSYDPKRHSSPGIPILLYHRTQKPIRGLAVTKADYCSHMIETPGQILPDGRKVFVYNDFPKFFDISFVWVGADRTARVMWHMGSSKGGPKSRPATLSELMSKGASDMSKTSSEKAEPGTLLTRERIRHLGKTAMDKEVRGGLARKVELCANSEVDLPFGEMSDFSKAFGVRTLLSTLGGLGIAMKPQEFHGVVGTEHPMHRKVASMAAEHNMTFKTSLPGFETQYAVDPKLFSLKLARLLLPYMESRSSFAPHLHVRLETLVKTAAAPVSQVIDAIFVHGIAAAYNGYRASLVKEAGTLLPKYFEVSPPSSSELMKVSSSGGLLLSSPTVVHWLSAHLERGAEVEVELDVATKYVMQNPEYSKLGALGTEVCSQMKSSINYMTALKMAVQAAL